MFFYLFIGFLIYLAYQVLFKLVIPIYRATRQVKRSFRDMQDRMQAHSQPESFETTNNNRSERAPKKGDYIDFEEVRD